ncbi:MAG: sulfatase [Verrucomicrobiota bacterium]
MKLPHIVFVFPDQLRRISLSCEGGPVPTPHMDRLTREGTSFSRAMVNYPMCTPSRGSLMTGRPAHALRDDRGEVYMMNDRQLDPTETTYAHVLTAAGYRCSYFGKWHNDAQRGPIPPGPRRLGFDGDFRSFQTGSPRLNPFYYSDEGERIDSPETWAPFMDTALALETLGDGHGRGEPQMLALSYNPPHGPYDILPPELEHYFDEARDSVTELAPNVPDELKEQALEVMAQYHAQVRGVDDAIGRLIDGLDQIGCADETLIVLSSDHGDQVLSHGLVGKNQFYDESLNVPLVAKWPGKIAAGRRIEGLASSCDIAPTLLDLVGLEIPSRMLGASLAPCLLHGESSPHDEVFAEVQHPWFDWFHGQGWQGNRRCVITNRYKLVVRERGTGEAEPYQLFDLQEDPHELNNLVKEEGKVPVISDLGRKLLRWMAQTQDPFFEVMLKELPPHERIMWRQKYTQPQKEPIANRALSEKTNNGFSKPLV